jgi:hypothetical protein
MKYAVLFCLTVFSLSAALAHDGHEHGPVTEKGKKDDSSSKKNVYIGEIEGYRFIESNGLPDHPTGPFPNRGNPNSIRAQSHHYKMTLTPKVAETITPLGMHPFGVAVNGIPFDPGAAEYWLRNPLSKWQYEALSGKIDLGMDQNHAHVQPTGAYHYHGLPTGLIEKLRGKEAKMVLLGYAADGFPIYGPMAYSNPTDPKSELKKLKSSYQLRTGTRPDGPGGVYDGTFVQDWEFKAGSGDLDECNGRTGVTPEYPQGTFYYVITDEYPFIPRNFRGTPDASFFRGPPDGRRPVGRPPFDAPLELEPLRDRRPPPPTFFEPPFKK